MKSTVTFKQFFYENTVGDALGGSNAGFSPDTPFSRDFYNTGSTVIATGGNVYTRSGIARKKNKKRRRKTKKNKK